MIKKSISYKFIPAVATMLCACSVQAFNWGISLNLPLVARPYHCAPSPSVSFGFTSGPKVVCFHESGVTKLLEATERNLCDSTESMYHSCVSDFRNLERYMHDICNNWFSWARGYVRAYGIYRSELEEVRETTAKIAHYFRRLERSSLYLSTYEYTQLEESLSSVACIVTRTSHYSCNDMHSVSMHLRQIKRILADI